MPPRDEPECFVAFAAVFNSFCTRESSIGRIVRHGRVNARMGGVVQKHWEGSAQNSRVCVVSTQQAIQKSHLCPAQTPMLDLGTWCGGFGLSRSATARFNEWCLASSTVLLQACLRLIDVVRGRLRRIWIYNCSTNRLD